VFLHTLTESGKHQAGFGIEKQPELEFHEREEYIHMSVSTLTLPAATSTKTAKSWAAQSATSALAPFSIPRRDPLPSDVAIDILYCGVCHSDLHMVRNEWNMTTYPVVPGHEIVGRVTRVGSAVTKFRKGDLAAVGCMVDSCRTCPNCVRGLEQYCVKFPILTYSSDRQASGRDDVRRLLGQHRRR
jgi:hypothetical protein